MTPDNCSLLFLEASLAHLSSSTCWLFPVTFAFACPQPCSLHHFPRDWSGMDHPVTSRMIFPTVSEDGGSHCLPPVNPGLILACRCSPPPWKQPLSPEASPLSLHRVTERHNHAYLVRHSPHSPSNCYQQVGNLIFFLRPTLYSCLRKGNGILRMENLILPVIAWIHQRFCPYLTFLLHPLTLKLLQFFLSLFNYVKIFLREVWALLHYCHKSNKNIQVLPVLDNHTWYKIGIIRYIMR